MDMYCVRLKESHQITSDVVHQKIEEMVLKTYEKRFPDVKSPESAYESYFYGSFEECQQFIKTLSDELKDLFECCECQPNELFNKD